MKSSWQSLVIGATAVLVALVLGMIATLFQMREAMLARDVAKKNARQAQRSAVIAGGALLLPLAKAEPLADEWFAEIRQRRSEPDANLKALAREEAQAVSWYSQLLLQNQQNERAGEVIDRVYTAAVEELGRDNATVLSLANSRVLLLLAKSDEPLKIADAWKELTQCVQQTQGEDEATALLPQLAAAQANAGQDEQAKKTIDDFVERRSKSSTPQSSIHRSRLVKSLDQLAKWGEEFPGAYEKLKRVRESGIASASQDDLDRDLAEDLRVLQGKWRHKGYDRGKLVLHIVLEIDGQASKATLFDVEDESKIIHVRNGRFELSRSGPVKIYTFYADEYPQQGISFAFRALPNRFFVVSGILTGYESRPEINMQTWYRIK